MKDKMFNEDQVETIANQSYDEGYDAGLERGREETERESFEQGYKKGTEDVINQVSKWLDSDTINALVEEYLNV